MSEKLKELEAEQKDLSEKLGKEVYVSQVRGAQYKAETDQRNEVINGLIAKILELNKQAHEIVNPPPPAPKLEEVPPPPPEAI